jgi:hypothetical protein
MKRLALCLLLVLAAAATLSTLVSNQAPALAIQGDPSPTPLPFTPTAPRPTDAAPAPAIQSPPASAGTATPTANSALKESNRIRIQFSAGGETSGTLKRSFSCDLNADGVRELEVDPDALVSMTADTPDGKLTVTLDAGKVLALLKQGAGESATGPTVSASAGCPKGCATPPPGCLIKGNISIPSGAKIYHVPGGASYEATKIDPRGGERWFCTEAEAVANGWRKSQQ